MPIGIFDELERHEKKEKDFISQLGIAANLFGVISVSAALKILDGKDIRPDIYIDMWDQLDVYTVEDRERQEECRAQWNKKLEALSNG